MATPIKQIQVGSTNYNITGHFYGTCGTAAGTAAKAVTCAEFTADDLIAGALVIVKFSYTNTAGTPTLNVNSKGAKNIFYQGAQITTGDEKGLLKGVCIFTYDGTQFHLICSDGGGSTVPTHTHPITNTTADTGSTTATGTVTGSLSGTVLTLGFSGTAHTHSYTKPPTATGQNS